MEWSKIYLLALFLTLAVIFSGTSLYALSMNKPFLDTLRLAWIIAAVILMSIGIVSIIPLSEHSYMSPHGRGRAGVNPAIIREGVKHMRKREPKKLGIIFGIVGLTLLVLYFLALS
ncbi:hypothetical protein KAU55_06155 [Candidatus Bathyarchaeota archaeon]|nr:hypothetical protein [Candidatus Bathyarchaeota archaeon]